ncbi:MerR family transcriptional regulator [Paenibacillus sepulcri]|uniref:MerR family transcriptional regulator n=1 Tax=Paenibacillus sepulcri TaxID=359917 RepID=A0ABS7BYH5_9BACL|nr:MerR family transcriptional regulator [Paenibacillus sepulcri]
MEETFAIAEFSKRTGLSQDTIRYYEKIGLLPAPMRRANGQREYVKIDLDRVLFITHLKRTDMSLKKILEYVTRSKEKDYEECYSILDEHKQHIESQLADMQTTLDILKYKLDNFQALKTGKRTEDL